jgi:hypothetical protein
VICNIKKEEKEKKKGRETGTYKEGRTRKEKRKRDWYILL